MINRFNIRVYGILEHKGKFLLLRERFREHVFIKFPGGGLEYGEGPAECVVREFKEELNLDIEIMEHFYTTDFFQASLFSSNDQIVSIYYRVQTINLNNMKLLNNPNEKIEPEEILWLDPRKDGVDVIYFPIDKRVWNKLIAGV